MVPPNRIQELDVAWRALAGESGSVGWRTIQVNVSAGPKVKAGRKFPDDAEAVLLGFQLHHPPKGTNLPLGRGFEVATVDLGTSAGGLTWVALIRNGHASREMFGLMSADVVQAAESEAHADGSRQIAIVLARIRAWQDFMERQSPGLLSMEAEVGLIGELIMLRAYIDMGIAPAAAIGAWDGPLNGLHDYSFGRGAIEVKTSAAGPGFVAKVFSLDQLDCSIKQPLFLACVRLVADPTGQSLPMIVEMLRSLLGTDAGALANFNTRLVHAGYLDAMAESYGRPYAVRDTRLLVVDENLPVLTRRMAGPAVRRASYEIDLDLIAGPLVSLAAALSSLGVHDGAC